MRSIKMWLLLAIGVVLACGLPAVVKEQAGNIPGQIEQAQTRVGKVQADFEKYRQGDEYKEFLEVYGQRENWSANFTKALARVDDARGILEKKVQPLIEQNDKQTVDAVRVELKRITEALREARTLAAEPGQRMEFLKEARQEGPEWVKAATVELAELQLLYTDLSAVVKTAQTDHPDKMDDLTGRLGQSKQLYEQAVKQLESAQTELGNDVPDYALLGDGCKIVANNLAVIKDQDKALRARIAELGQSYSRRLVDMNIEYFVQVGRTSWSNKYDYPTEHEYTYSPRQVNEEGYGFFAPLIDKPIVAYTRGWTGWGQRIGIDKNRWNALEIDWQERWPRGDDDSEFRIDDTPTSFFHKYVDIRNGVETKGDWQKVSEEVYDANEENLGMTIISKPYGQYEEEVSLVASPAGMDKVGNPRYGRWETGPDGRRRWSFLETYAFYHLIFGGRRHYYYHDNWTGWRRDYRGRKPYYGPATDPARYGTYSNNTRQSYAGSTFAKRGGFRTQAPSTRAAGTATRGRGPGGRGK
jgi:hypothetical protein